MKFSELKQEAKQKLSLNYGYLLMLFLPMWIFRLVFTGTNYNQYLAQFDYIRKGFKNYDNYATVSSQTSHFSWTSLIISALTIGAMIVCINIVRNQNDNSSAASAFGKAFNVFTSLDNIWGAFSIGFFKSLYIFCYTILGVVAVIIGAFVTGLSSGIGIIIIVVSLIYLLVISVYKTLAYSQAQYLYRDSIADSNKTKLGFRESISTSNELMKGHKGELFLLLLSFIGWFFLSIITLGIASFFYVTPYVALTMAAYYDKLTKGIFNKDSQTDSNSSSEPNVE